MDHRLAVDKWGKEAEFTNKLLDWLEDKKTSIKDLVGDIINIEIGYKTMLIEREYEIHDGTFVPEKLDEMVRSILENDSNFAYWYAKYKEEVK